jgi:hypothetical protein
MSIHMHIIQRNYLATFDLRAQAQATDLVLHTYTW